VIDQIVPPSPSICTALDWDRVGEVLAVIQAGSSALILWTLSTRKVRIVETPVIVKHGSTLPFSPNIRASPIPSDVDVSRWSWWRRA
jgi:hypothetical protein